MDNVKISIIVPIYRVEEYLHQCIDSIINQTYNNLEIILIDDGSDDDCPRICDEYAQKDARIKVIHKENGGQDSARKIGIQSATGKYVAYVDGDDWIEPEMYEKLISIAEENKVLVVESGIIDSIGDYTYTRHSSLREGVYIGKKFEEKVEPYILYNGNFFENGIIGSLCNKIYEKELLTKYQMLPDKSEHLTDDIMCSLPCIVESKSICIIHEGFYHYRVRNSSHTHTQKSNIENTVSRCYNDWIDRFACAAVSSNIVKQIDYFVMYLLLMKAIYVFDDPESEFVLTPYGKIRKDAKIVLYGAGVTGISMYDYLVDKLGCRVKWVDKNYRNLQETLQVCSPDILLTEKYDVIVISVMWASKVQEIREELIGKGIEESKIRWISEEYICNPKSLLDKAKYNDISLFA